MFTCIYVFRQDACPHRMAPLSEGRVEDDGAPLPPPADVVRHRLNGYLAQRVPSLFLASSSRNCLNGAVPKGMFPWMTRYPLSQCRRGRGPPLGRTLQMGAPESACRKRHFLKQQSVCRRSSASAARPRTGLGRTSEAHEV